MEVPQHGHSAFASDLESYAGSWSAFDTFNPDLTHWDEQSWLSDAFNIEALTNITPEYGQGPQVAGELDNGTFLHEENALCCVRGDPSDAIDSGNNIHTAPDIVSGPRGLGKPERAIQRMRVTRSTRAVQKLRRTKISEANKTVLENCFLKNPYPDKCEISALQSATKLKIRVIQTWFSNARSRKEGQNRTRCSRPIVRLTKIHSAARQVFRNWLFSRRSEFSRH